VQTVGGIPQISGLINGAAVGTPLVTTAGHLYLFTLRAYAPEYRRVSQRFHSSAHPAGNPRGGAAISAAVRIVLEVHDVDPANPASQTAPPTVLFDDFLPNPPAFCTFAPVNVATAQLGTDAIRLLRDVGVEVRSGVFGGSFRTCHAGAQHEGGECTVSSKQVKFYPQSLPASGTLICMRYRDSARCDARVSDSGSIAAQAHGLDSGIRRLVKGVSNPPARSADDCETAALALLDDSTQAAHSGEYRTWSDFLPNGDIWPGDAISFTAPSRNAQFTAVVRDVKLDFVDPLNDRCQYTVSFASESAQPLALELKSSRAHVAPLAIDRAQVGATTLPDLASAEIVALSSGNVTIDCGVAPPAGGGFEVRSTDGNWGPGGQRNLVGRFTTQSFNVPKLTRIASYYVRQYDSSSPPRYSRHSTLLKVNSP
jgi:hypothetical protein